MATYPTGIPALARPVTGDPGNNGSATDATVVVDAISDEIEAIATELGTNPSGSEATVAARFSAAAAAPRAPLFGEQFLQASAYPCTQQFVANHSTLAWDGSGGVTVDLANVALSDAQRDAYSSVHLQRSTAWLTNAMIEPAHGVYDVGFPWRFGVTTNSTRVRLRGTIHTGRDYPPVVLVNGSPVLAGVSVARPTYDGNKAGLLLTFPTAEYKTVEVLTRMSLDQLITDSGSTTTPYASKHKMVGWIGDSWSEGVTQSGYLGLVELVQMMTGWRIHSNSQGGTGFVNAGSGSKTVFGSTERVSGVCSSTPSLVVFFGSINDAAQSPSTVGTACGAALDAVAAAAPSAKVIVFGPQLTDSGNPANLAAMQSAAASRSNCLGVIDPTSFTALTGVTGPSDLTHPSPVGLPYVAASIVYQIRRTLAVAGVTGY